MKTLNIILSLTLLFVLNGCNDDFMEKYPLDKITDKNYWKTPNDLKVYANQFYPDLNNDFMRDNKSDNQGPNSKESYIWNEYAVPANAGGWSKGDWSKIRSCNFFLQRYHTVVGEESAINMYVGEVLFFKAKYYYEKVTTFGNVPWLSKDLTTSSEELFAPRDSRTLVIDSINVCLDKAIAYLPETSKDGRITKYAALALKSRVCLFEGTYQKYNNQGQSEKYLRQSADASKAIMDSGLFELYSTGKPEEDFHSFFQLQDMTGNKEAIFFVQYIVDKRQHNRVRTVRESKTGFTKDFAESFLCRTDGLPISLSKDYKGDAKYTDEFENRDYRMKQTIYTPDQPIFITTEGVKEFENAPIFSNLANTGYRINKMYSPLAADNEYQKCAIDECIFRYAEVLLNYAEAKAELGECDQSVIDLTINKLRDRVAMPAMTLPISFTDTAWPKWEVAVSPLINEIRRERRIELACEGFRWNDLCRWKAGKLLENKKTYLGARDPETGEYRALYPGMTRVWNDRLYLSPIPTDELSYNPQLLPQNPGW